jgi:hypothetical protein
MPLIYFRTLTYKVKKDNVIWTPCAMITHMIDWLSSFLHIYTEELQAIKKYIN